MYAGKNGMSEDGCCGSGCLSNIRHEWTVRDYVYSTEVLHVVRRVHRRVSFTNNHYTYF